MESRKMMDDVTKKYQEYDAYFQRQDQYWDARLDAVLTGGSPINNAERLALARWAYATHQYSTAAQLWDQAFDADPDLAKSRRSRDRYKAACAAVLAAAGASGEIRTRPSPVERKGKALDHAAKTQLREQARVWLRAELDAWSKLLESATYLQRKDIRETLWHWQLDIELAGIRDPKPLAKLPEDERKAWESLWAEVRKTVRNDYR
jgi:hypothetical protein